ncbi:thioredoxin domain-containing protein [Saccharopolyspora rhizosphaerae]|uniref:Thioredoxin domain-containing protein n=1 Tax=Saccharopolyspora rhizosphaerae TaxID=2492662 RepID=A0A3R8QM94_9PSEU|nr:thioredoxin domain-containing protein [Saccharopolyspora rhizosphaerae]RRO15519.1 thioredoxin domain-containing protein [Saccharopolyspora rhizosphaerae]
MANRLADATSPYLLQHADNPVDWWPWCPEAFEEARRRDVPVLLSIGYAACHWCHVMAHESFEDDDTARLMNEHFVNIKVDREERPDIDAVYMEATQAMTGQGGWPMTCFLTPAGEPFHCGTYYPSSPMPGMPSFQQLLAAVAQAWDGRGEEVRKAAGRIVEQLNAQRAPLPESLLDDEVLTGAVGRLRTESDAENGGFGDAPKFPPSMVLEFLLRHHERTGSPQALDLAHDCCTAMARGGIYDQLAGGFARYSVDAAWVVPHFEKMLYDNALLLRAYAHLGRLGDALAARVARETAGFLLRDLRTPEGGFVASLDADTEGVEGLTYVWTPGQLREVLGEADGDWAASLLVVTPGGTFEDGASTLQLPHDPDDPERWARVRERLLAAREQRPQPGRDDKVVTAWNGLAITALVEAGATLDEPSWVEAAAGAAELLLAKHRADGRLLRTSRRGVAGTAAGVLEDYGCFADGLLSLHQATADPRWLTAACELLDIALEQFADSEHPGTFHDTAADAEELVRRPSDPTDNASPSGAAALTAALLTASALVGPEATSRYRAAAEQALSRVGLLAQRVPRFAGHWLAVAEARAQGPLQIAVVGPDETSRADLLAVAHRDAPGGTVVVGSTPDAAGVPLLADRPLVDGAPAAYVCHGYVCDRPVTNAHELAENLAQA